MQMPRMDGFGLLSRAKEKGANCEIIMMTAYTGVDAAVAAVKGGAYHFITKPFVSNDAVRPCSLAGVVITRI